MFTRDLNLTIPERRTLERLFVNSDPRCTFLPRNTHQIVPLRRCNVSEAHHLEIGDVLLNVSIETF